MEHDLTNLRYLVRPNLPSPHGGLARLCPARHSHPRGWGGPLRVGVHSGDQHLAARAHVFARDTGAGPRNYIACRISYGDDSIVESRLDMHNTIGNVLFFFFLCPGFFWHL